jgi:hypothetical protein
MRISSDTAGPLEASVFVEGLRAHPAWFVGLALGAHALIWAIALQIAEPSPPAELAVALALGREWMPGYAGLPPLAAWVAEAIYRPTGSLFLLRLFAAICVALAGWIVFLFARRVVGDRQGAIAVLLMAGVYPVAFPVGPLNNDTLQMPLAAAAILCWWLAVGERKVNAWIVLGLILGIMIYAGPQGIMLAIIFAAVTAFSARARTSLARFDALLCLLFGLFVFLFVITPRMLWLARNGFSNLFANTDAGIDPRALAGPLELLLTLLAGHAGLVALVFLATVYAVRAKENAPVFIRMNESLLSRRAATALAVAPAALALLALFALGMPAKVSIAASLSMLTGLLAVLMTGARLVIRRQRLVAFTALGLLIVPPALEVASGLASPWFAEQVRSTNWPARAAARTFTEIFRTRTGRELEYVVGERIPAAQISVMSRARPRVFIDGDLAASPWIDAAQFKARGGVVFWEIRGADGSPPAWLVAWLPPFTPEAPLRLPRERGGTDPLRLGWAIVPPAQ